jgi:hypothetical protein
MPNVGFQTLLGKRMKGPVFELPHAMRSALLRNWQSQLAHEGFKIKIVKTLTTNLRRSQIITKENNFVKNKLMCLPLLELCLYLVILLPLRLRHYAWRG